MTRLSPSKVLIGIIAVISFFIFLDTPYTGDDLAYKGVFGGASPVYDSWFSYPRWVVSHWLHTNGRMANYLMPLLGALPKGIVAPICAAVLMMMYSLAVKLSSAKGFMGVCLVAAICFALPWWDSMFIFDCQTNYVWASAFNLLAAQLIFSAKDNSRGFPAITAAVCLIAGMMHEAASMPLLVGFAIYILYARWRPTRRQWILLAAFAIGTACVLFSPGIIMRAGRDVPADDPLLLLLLKSDIIAAALWCCIAVAAVLPKWRCGLKTFFQSKLSIFAVAALFSMAVSLASGVVGRSGWFAELFAMIVIFGWLGRRFHPKAIWADVAVGAIVAAHLLGVAVWQNKLGKEFESFNDAYLASEDGTVFMDYTRDDSLPWWALGRLRGILDPDDAWLLVCHSKYYRADGAWPVVLPTEAQEFIPLGADEELLGNGDMLTRSLPLETDDIVLPREGLAIKISEIDGKQWVAQPLPDGGWHLSPRMLDPGDR